MVELTFRRNEKQVSRKDAKAQRKDLTIFFAPLRLQREARLLSRNNFFVRQHGRCEANQKKCLTEKSICLIHCDFVLHSEGRRRRLETSMRTNLTNRKRATESAATAATWQLCASMLGATISVMRTGSLPTYFIGGGLRQQRQGLESIESLMLSDNRHSHNS
jgi:hypothetical protein